MLSQAPAPIRQTHMWNKSPVSSAVFAADNHCGLQLASRFGVEIASGNSMRSLCTMNTLFGAGLVGSHRWKMGVFRCVLLFLLVHHQHYATGDGTQPIRYSESGSADLAATSPAKQKTKFPLRKCCPPGKVYHQFSNGAHETGEKCQDHQNADHESSILIEVSQQLFFGKSDNDSAHYEETDFDIISGFPEGCKAMMLLEPGAMPSDRFYPLANGDLVVPHRFWIFPPESHCMEDFFTDHDYNKVKRVAIICLDKARTFPSEAIDGDNRLQLSFLDHRDSASGLESLSGRPVVRKCCDINEVYWVLNHTCIPKQGYATQYFDDLLSNGDNVFVQTGQIRDCNTSQQVQAEWFEWTTEYKLQIQLTTDHEGWCPHLFTNDEYCIDDFVVPVNDELPETITIATVCREKVKPVLPPSVYDFCFDEQAISVPPSNDVNLEEPASSDGDVEQAASSDNKEKALKIHLPKCCPRGFVVEDGVCHQLYRLQDQVPKLESALLNSVKEFSIGAHNKTLGLTYQDQFNCDHIQSRPLNKSSLNDFPQWTLRFRAGGQNETSFHLSYYQENYWDYDSKIPHYCVDLKLIPNKHEIKYEPYVFYCHLPSSISGSYPVLLYLSSIGLILTFVMYFFTPAKGTSGNVTPADDTEAKSGPKPCHCQNMLATPIASRNFLSHISSLCLAFVCLAVTQQELVQPGQPGCVAIGYITYAATIASFSWFTVYCFHFFCMFRLSLLTKNNIIYLPYSLFGWGIPLIALAMAVTAQFHTNSNLPKSINPNMGLFRCWFGNETSILVFFYVPICFLLSLSSIFFTSLLLLDPKFRHCKKETKFNSRFRSKQSQENRQDSAKKVDIIYFATGVAWIFEIVAWIPFYFTVVPNERWLSLSYLFEAGSVLNASRGILVFVLFVLFQRDVRGHMLRGLINIPSAFGIVLRRQGARSTTDSTRRIISSQNSTSSTSANSSKRSLTGDEHPAMSPNVRGPSCASDEVTEL